MTEQDKEYLDLILHYTPGESIKDKWLYMRSLIWENDSCKEIELLNVVYELKRIHGLIV